MEPADLGVFETILKGAQDYGLGIALSAFVAFTFLYVLRQLYASHKEDREAYKEDRERFMGIISKQDTTINNHLSHVEGALISQEKALVEQSSQFREGIEKINTSIENQTKVITLMLKLKDATNEGDE